MSDQRGFTLAELIIAMVLIGIVVVVGLQFLVYCQRFIIRSGTKLVGADFARVTMEELYQDHYDSLNVGTELKPLPTEDGEFGGDVADQYVGSREYTVTEKTGYKVIEVTVEITK